MGSNVHSSSPETDVCTARARDDLRPISQRFRRYGIVTVTDLIEEPKRKAMREEAERLLDRHAERRDLRLATTANTRRSMSVVPSEVIEDHSLPVTETYADPGLIAALESIAREKLHPCPKADERYLITRQEQRGDTHGWHWGDFSFALIWILRAPPIDVGGLLQCIPHTEWDKSAPKINQYLVDNPIRSYHFAAGDAYFLRTDTTLHRTVPLAEDATRIILNMTWAADRDLSRTLKDDDRWWDNAEVPAASSLTD